MIFLTVGTHEQQFNRLVEYLDKWAGKYREDVVIQTGFSTYQPKNCKWQKLFSYQEMVDYIRKARIVITHGGPSSFIMPLQIGKIPIVVPRRAELDEHVNNHQVEFCKAVAERQGNIIVIDDIEELGVLLEKYDEVIAGMNKEIKSNNEEFISSFRQIIDSMGLK